MTTLLQARSTYFEANGFGADGGYSKSTVTVVVFGLPVSFPNTQARRRAVVFHDLHHIATGYLTNNLGESEISAWELGSGCWAYRAAWVLNTWGLLLGGFKNPARVFQAFVRGRQTTNLYGRDADALLAREVEDVRQEMGLDAPRGRPSVADAAVFGLHLALSMSTAAVPVVFTVYLLRALL
ncbi:MAG: hypothetical protein KUG77_00860 [Nannocystaceae bacterium]|nr:hypothetical protein [Nannocystaceae bacterium]